MKKTLCLLVTMTILFTACAQSPAAPAWQEQYDLGVRYLSEGNYQEAIIAFTAAIEIDPKRADAYLSLADAYIATGNAEAAREILQQGYDATGDEGLAERLSQLELAGLMVLTHQETYRYKDNWRTVNSFEYDANGYLIRKEERSTSDDREAETVIDTWEYNTDTDQWLNYRDSVRDEGYEMRGRDRKPGTDSYTHTMGNVLAAPFPTKDPPENSGIVFEGEHPARVEVYIDPAYPEIYETTWRTADYEYDEYGNAVFITSYDVSGVESGYCILEWAVFQPDGSLLPLGGGHLKARPDTDRENLLYSGKEGDSVFEFMTDNMLTLDEVTIDGIPFYQLSIYEAMELLPENNGPFPDVREHGDLGLSYDVSMSGRSVIEVKQATGYSTITKIRYTDWQWDGVSLELDTGIRGIRTGASVAHVLEAVGFSSEGAARLADEAHVISLDFVANDFIMSSSRAKHDELFGADGDFTLSFQFSKDYHLIMTFTDGILDGYGAGLMSQW